MDQSTKVQVSGDSSTSPLTLHSLRNDEKLRVGLNH